MTRMRKVKVLFRHFSPKAIGFLVALGMMTVGSVVQAVHISGTATQLTTDSSTQFDPAISGDLVVYTDLRNGNADVYAFDLANGVEVQITTSPSAQTLHDVSGRRIVYQDNGTGMVFVYDFDTGVSFSLVATSLQTNPAIDGDLVVYQSGGDIYAVDLTTGVVIAITNTPEFEARPSVSGSRVVFERFSDAGSFDIYWVDIATGVETAVATSAVHERAPYINGDIIVWDAPAADGSNSDIYLYNIVTGVTSRLALPGNQRRAHVSGALIAFDDDSTGDLDVVLYDIQTLSLHRITGAGSSDSLNDIDGNRVVYTSDASGNDDIWVYTFTLPGGAVTKITSPSQCGAGALTIDFDDQDPSTFVGNEYASLGVIFVDDDLVTPVLLAPFNRGFADTISEPYSLGISAATPEPGSRNLPLTIEFDPPVLCVGLYMGNGETLNPTGVLTAFDQIGAEIGSVSGSVPEPVLEFLGLASTIPIAKATLDYGDTLLAETIDNLTFASAVDIEVAPLQVEFGDVAVGANTSAIVTISNLGVADLTVSDISLASGVGPFSIIPAPSLPAVIAPGATGDVELTFAPTAVGFFSDILLITSNDPGEGLVEVPLTGTGVVSEPPPLQQILDILDFFDASVADGTLGGNGPGRSGPGRLRALRNMIEAAGDLMAEGLIAEACSQLQDALDRADGDPRPPDFVTGEAAEALAILIQDLMTALGCS